MPRPRAGDEIDWHVHSHHSIDSNMTPVDACAVAASRGLKGACFTEHLDLDPRDAGVGFLDHDAYLASIGEARAVAPAGFTVLTGIELNWQQVFSPGLLEYVKGKHFDLVLGSVHWVSSGHVIEDRAYQHESMDEFLDEWIHEALDLLRRGICDGFAHYDYFLWKGSQFYPGLTRESVYDLTRDVVDAIITAGVSLEVNTSALRKGFNEPFPGWVFLERYFKEGGRRVHLGSDAHAPEHVGLAFPRVEAVVSSLASK